MALGLPPDEKCVDDQVLRYQNAWAQRMADILKVHLCLATQKILELSFGRKKQDNVQCEGIQNKKQIAGNCFFLCDASCLLILPIFQSKARMNQSVCMVPITSSPLSISASHLVVTNPCLVCICICIITIIIIIDNYNNYIYIYYNMYVYIYKYHNNNN